MRRVVVPPAPGVFSATGLAKAGPGVEESATVLADPRERDSLDEVLGALERRARARLRAQGIASRRVRVERLADLRYAGQSHEIAVRYGDAMTRRFEREHRDRYGHVRSGARIEVVTVRARAWALESPQRGGGESPLPAQARGAGKAQGGKGRSGATRTGRIVWEGRRRICAVLQRGDLRAEGVVEGPARICEYSATTFVAPGWQARTGARGALVLTPAGKRRRS